MFSTPTLRIYPSEGQILRECGTPPLAAEQYNISYHFNYLNIGLLVAVVFFAVILVKKNYGAIISIFDVLKRYRLSIALGLLVVALMLSLFNPVKPSRWSKFERDLRNSFYQTSSTSSQAYLDYMSCKNNLVQTVK